MIGIPKLEMHLADACNLRCAGCTHYSDHGLSGVQAVDEGGEWLSAWAARVEPLRFSFLGGEPLLNRSAPDFLLLARRLWPRTQISLVSNGLLLDRSTSLWAALQATATTLVVSVHSRDQEFLERLRPNVERTQEESERRGFGFVLRNSVDGWFKLYRNEGPAMEPYSDGDPASSWRSCKTKHCVTLHDCALWKCPPLAHLQKVARKHGLADRSSWQPYLEYRPLTLDATDDEIRAFVGRGPESSCGMCPAQLTYVDKPDV